jgi:uncharacterized membrane protein
MRGVSVHAALLVAHILSGAVTIGATASYAVWIALAERQPEHLPFTIRAVRRSDRLVAIPAFLLALVSGVWLAIDAGLAFERPWLAASIAIYVLVLVVGFAVFGPMVRSELAALERGGTGDPEYRVLRARARLLSYGTIVALIAILWLMVARPG